MHLLEVVSKEGLLGKPQPVRKAEEGGGNHHRPRAHRDKGAAKEKLPIAEEEAREAPNVVVRAKEELMRKVLLMAEGDKGSEVAKPLEARVDKAPVEPSKAAMKSAQAPVKAANVASSCMTREASSESAEAMGPGLGSQQR
jgi:hypothetical protein